MSWIGKIVGGALGFALGGPLGAIAGAAFGHAFDRSNEGYHLEESTRTKPGEQAQFTFFVAVFSMLAKLSRADGQITRDEIDTINRFMLQDLNLDPQSRMVAMNIFNAAVESPNSFEDFATQFFSHFQDQPQLLEMMVDILLRVSIADGTINIVEERLILSAVRIFNFSDIYYQSLKQKYVRPNDRYYAVLGVTKSDSDDKIKSRYRKLVMEYHPDKIVSKGLPEEFTRFAEEKFKDIQQAYDEIKKERGVK
jgi:DnaJ like chaperone protein